MAAAVEDGAEPFQTEPGADQGARACRAADLVAAYRHEVRTELFLVEGQPSGELGGVAVEECARRVDALGDFAHRVENAGLTVGSHDGYQQNIRTYHLSEPVGIDESARRHRDDVHLGLLRFPEPCGGLGDRGVFHRREEDSVTVCRSCFDCPPQHQVVRFGGAGGEDDTR